MSYEIWVTFKDGSKMRLHAVDKYAVVTEDAASALISTTPKNNCLTCKGTGSVGEAVYTDIIMVDCPSCKGTGI